MGLDGDFILDDASNIIDNYSLHLENPTLEDFLYAAYSFEPGGSSSALSILSFSLFSFFSWLYPLLLNLLKSNYFIFLHCFFGRFAQENNSSG